MATPPRCFETDKYYHIYNCGVGKCTLFPSDHFYAYFLKLVSYYLYNQKIPFSQFKALTGKIKGRYFNFNPTGSRTRRVGIIAYCLMPNHFHFVLNMRRIDGISRFISDIANSYTRYFNIMEDRVGRLFQGPFKAKTISTDEALMQVTRYVHLNPVASLGKRANKLFYLENYPYSSYLSWINFSNYHPKNSSILNGEDVIEWIEQTGGVRAYKDFVLSKIDKNSSVGIEDIAFD